MKHKYLPVILLCWLCLCSYLFHMIYADARKEAIDRLNALQLTHARQAQRGIEEFFNNTLEFVTQLSVSEHIIDFDGQGRQELDFAKKIAPKSILAITRVQADGKIGYTAPYQPGMIGMDLSGQEHISRILKTHQTVISDVFTAVQGYQAVALHVPVFKGEQFQGSLGLLIDFFTISRRFLETIHLGETGYSWMTSRDGTELYCPVPGHTGKSVFENCKEFPTILSMAEEMLKGRKGVTTYEFDRIRDQHLETIKKHAVYLPINIADSFWSIVVSSSEDEVLETLVSFRNKLVFLFILFSGGSSLFLYYGIRAWGIIRDASERKKTEQVLRESEAKYRLIFNQSPVGIMHFDKNGVITECNEAYERIIGASRQKLIGFNMVESMPEGPARMAVENTLKYGRGHFEGAYQTVTGNKNIIIRAEHRTIIDKEKEFLGAVGIFEDISERLQAEEALRKSEERFKLAMEASRDGLWDWDVKNNNVYFSPGYAAILGYSKDEMPAHVSSWKELMHPEDRKIVFRKNMDCIKNLKDDFEVEFRMQAKNGEWRWILGRGKAVARDSDGRATRMIGTHTDITEHKKSEEALRYERDLIERMMETSPAGIVRVEAGGSVVYANRRAEEILGISRPDASGKLYNDPDWKITGLQGEAFPEENLPFYRVKSSGKTITDIQHAIEWPDGKRVLLSINAAPLLEAGGDFDGIIATIEDITDKFEAEQKYQMLFREMLDGFALHEIICDDQGYPRDYRFIDINPAFERLTGLKGEDVIGRTVLEVMPDTESYWIEKYGKVALTGEPVFFENYAKVLGRHFQVTAFRPSKNQFACIFVDVTDRKVAEFALRETTERFQKVFNSQLDAIMVLNAEIPAKVLESNRASTVIFGYETGELVGDTIDKLHVNEAYKNEFHHQLFAAVKKEGYLNDFRFSMRRKDGSIFPSEHMVLELKNDDNIRTGWVSVIRDLTEKRALEARLQQAQKMESIGNLAGGIAHDFNNILFPIVGMSELLLEDLPKDSPEHENAREILMAGRRGSDLVKQILAFSRQAEQQMIPVRVQQVLREVLQLSRSTIPSNIEILQSLQSDCGLVMADPTQLHQIAMNLITNAYHAVEEYGGTISVELKQRVLEGKDLAGSSLEPGSYAVLTVSDTGIGIDASIKDKIFEPYFTTKAKGKGTGLGLAVVYGIIKDYRGEIRVYSEPGQGTTFNVYLPLMETDHELMISSDEKMDITGNERILLVDDEAAIAGLVKQILERLGYQVIDKTSSLVALNIFKSDPSMVDLVITDMTMPNLTGDQLAREVLRIRPDIPVIICTGFSERITKEKAEMIGVKGFLMKPVVKSELASMVRNLLDEVMGKGHDL